MNFQDNFGTNLTSNTNAGATTSPINPIPTVDAPFYIAFDATNLNSHYEVLAITSKTATNVNHAATAYDHTTDEEVRLVQPARHINAMQNLPEGTMFNGKIVPSVASNNLTVALKTKAGTDPSATDPVYVMIGGTLRTITSALSVEVIAGYSWCNAGGAELATKEIDWFVYLGVKTSDSTIKIGISRVPFANLGSEFDASLVTAEKYGRFTDAEVTTGIGSVVNIGRFAATLSAGAGYTWSVPTFTATNLIQRPIYETRFLNWAPTFAGFSSPPNPGATFTYKLSGNICRISNHAASTGTSNATNFTMTLPFASLQAHYHNACAAHDAGINQTTPGNIELAASSATASAFKSFYQIAWTNSGTKIIWFNNISYEI